MPNFVEIARTAGEISRFFSNFQDGGRRHVGFFKFKIFNSQKCQEGRNASVCQTSLQSYELRPRYGDFSIFQDGGSRHLGFSKFEIFNVRNGQEVELRNHAKFCRNRSNRGSNIAI